uniref:Uncharacterized protein n=1 Tax=Homo sapiens TaxID=9606 RepID=B9EIP9_HUMAN|nr:Unknown (protein for MGC:176441) [Homo sapiens]
MTSGDILLCYITEIFGALLQEESLLLRQMTSRVAKRQRCAFDDGQPVPLSVDDQGLSVSGLMATAAASTRRPGASSCSAGVTARSTPRFGSLETCNIVDSFEEVEDSLYVPQYNKYGEERVIVFLKTASGHAFQPDLVKRICDAIRVGLSVRHVPSLILETKGIAQVEGGVIRAHELHMDPCMKRSGAQSRRAISISQREGRRHHTK